NRSQYDITTRNLTRLVLRQTDRATSITIDGQKLRVKSAPEMTLAKSKERWKLASARERRIRKKHGLQGPIDDAFLEPFLVVRPTGTPWNAAPNEQALNGKLPPLHWTKKAVALGNTSFPAAESLPPLIYPDPVSPDHYVVIN